MLFTPLPKVVQLDVTPNGAFAWNGEFVANRDELEARLREAAAQPDPPEIHLRPDRRVKYDFVAKVLAAAQRNRMKKIGFVNTSEFKD